MVHQGRLTDETSRNGGDHGAADGRQDDEGHRVLVVLGLPHVGDHAQGDGSAGGGEATERAEGEDGAEVRGQGAGDLPEVDEAEGDLQDPAATEFLGGKRSVT